MMPEQMSDRKATDVQPRTWRSWSYTKHSHAHEHSSAYPFRTIPATGVGKSTVEHYGRFGRFGLVAQRDQGHHVVMWSPSPISLRGLAVREMEVTDISRRARIEGDWSIPTVTGRRKQGNPTPIVILAFLLVTMRLMTWTTTSDVQRWPGQECDCYYPPISIPPHATSDQLARMCTSLLQLPPTM